MTKETPTSSDVVNSNWHLTWMFVLAVIGIVWWIPIAGMVQLTYADPSSGILVGIGFLVWNVVGRLVKWGVLVTVSTFFFTRRLPSEQLNNALAKFTLSAAATTLLELIAYFTMFGMSGLQHFLFGGFIIDLCFPIVAVLITLYFIRRARSAREA